MLFILYEVYELLVLLELPLERLLEWALEERQELVRRLLLWLRQVLGWKRRPMVSLLELVPSFVLQRQELLPELMLEVLPQEPS